MSFLSIIRVQETSDLNSSPVVQLIHLGFVSISIAQTRSPTHVTVESQSDNRKEGWVLSSCALVCWSIFYLLGSISSGFVSPLHGNFMRSAPDDTHEISAWLCFWLLCWPSAVMDCFLKIFCVFCQVPWVVAQSDRNHIHVFVSAAWTIFYFLLSIWLHLVVPLCLPVWCITFQRLFFEAL